MQKTSYMEQSSKVNKLYICELDLFWCSSNGIQGGDPGAPSSHRCLRAGIGLLWHQTLFWKMHTPQNEKHLPPAESWEEDPVVFNQRRAS